MRRLLLGLALVGAFLAGGLLMNGRIIQADDKTEPKVRGTLYANWKKLGLTEEQTQKIYKIPATYRGQTEKREVQIRERKKKERAEADTVLTPAQKQRLKELSSGEPDKKTDAAKPADKPADKAGEKKP